MSVTIATKPTKPSIPVSSPNTWGHMDRIPKNEPLNLEILISAIAFLEKRHPIYLLACGDHGAPEVIDLVVDTLEHCIPNNYYGIQTIAKAATLDKPFMQPFAAWIICRILSCIDEGELDREVLEEDGKWLECKTAWLGFVYNSHADLTNDYDRAINKAIDKRPKGTTMKQASDRIISWAGLLAGLRVASAWLRVHAIDYSPPQEANLSAAVARR